MGSGIQCCHVLGNGAWELKWDVSGVNTIEQLRIITMQDLKVR